MNKFLTYIKEHKFKTAYFALGILALTYFLLFNLKAEVSIKYGNVVYYECNYEAPFQIK